MVLHPHKQASRENSNAAFKDAHIYVHLKAVYILSLKESCGKGQNSRI